MLLKRLLSLSLLLTMAGTTLALSEQSAEARCCRQRCRQNRCCNTGYGYSNGYSGYSNCNSCSPTNGTMTPQPAPADGYAPAPSPPSAAPAPPPAPAPAT